MVNDIRAELFQVDIVLDREKEYDLKEWGVEGKVLHTPGHTPGSLSVVLDNEEAILMDMLALGDIAWWGIVSVQGETSPFS